MSDVARLLEQHKVKVWGPGNVPWKLRGVDVIHDELHLTVGPESGSKKWIVVVCDDEGKDTHAAETLEAALELANPDRAAVIVAFEVKAPDAGAARLAFKTGKRLFQFAWLGT